MAKTASEGSLLWEPEEIKVERPGVGHQGDTYPSGYALMKAAAELMGGIDVVVNVAGAQRSGAVTELDESNTEHDVPRAPGEGGLIQ